MVLRTLALVTLAGVTFVALGMTVFAPWVDQALKRAGERVTHRATTYRPESEPEKRVPRIVQRARGPADADGRAETGAGH